MTRRYIPIPSQTGGQCFFDSIISALFYADGTRQALWGTMFKVISPATGITIGDRSLSTEFLKRDVNNLMTTFLMVSSVRILRMLDSSDPGDKIRERSFSPGEDTHGTTPSELCSNLGTLLIQVRAGLGGDPESRLVDPRSRTSAHDYIGSVAPNKKPILKMVLVDFLPKVFPATKIGTFSTERIEGAQPVAFLVSIATPDVSAVHAIAIVRVNGSWFIADDTVGQLLQLNGPDDNPIPPETIANALEDTENFFVSLKLKAPDNSVETVRGYTASIVKLSDYSVVAKTREAKTLAFTTIPGIREPSMSDSILVEAILAPGHPEHPKNSRAMVYWAPPGGAAPAPAGAGGRRKTYRRRKSRRHGSASLRRYKTRRVSSR